MKANQNSRIDKIKKAIGILRKNLNESWLYFCIATELDSQYVSVISSKHNSFLYGAHDACIRTSSLTLAELLSSNNNSTNLHYFLNLAKNTSKLFQHVQKHDLLNSVKKYMIWLDSLESNGFLGNLFAKRDKTLAHTDRKYVNEIEPYFIKDYPPLNPDEVRNVYLEINQLLSDFERYFYGTPARIGFIDVEPEIKNEIRQLLEKQF